MSQASDTAILESLARETHAPMDAVVALYERERDALSQTATITNYIQLLAVRRVRDQLMQEYGEH